jgi:hypothetical protein
VSKIEPIYIDASKRASLRLAGKSLEYLTVEEAVRDWYNLPDDLKVRAILVITGTGTVYKAAEIQRLHFGPKPASWSGR